MDKLVDEITLENNEGKRLVNQMTNHLRNKWARAGYPGLSNSNYDVGQIRAFFEENTNA